MNDLLNDTTKPQNIEEIYYQVKTIVEKLYEKYIPNNVKKRKNKENAKMSDVQIISIENSKK